MEKENPNDNKINYKYLISLFYCLVILIVWVTIFKCNRLKAIRNIEDKVAFLNIYDRFMHQFSNLTIYQLKGESLMDKILNIIIFIPFTLFLPLIFRKNNIFRDIAFTFLFSALIELFQLIFALGGFEFIDLFTNVLGGVIGALIYRFSYKHVQIKTINKVLLGGLIVFIPFVLFAFINTIINYEMYIPFFDGTYLYYLTL